MTITRLMHFISNHLPHKSQDGTLLQGLPILLYFTKRKNMKLSHLRKFEGKHVWDIKSGTCRENTAKRKETLKLKIYQEKYEYTEKVNLNYIWIISNYFRLYILHWVKIQSVMKFFLTNSICIVAYRVYCNNISMYIHIS